MFKKIALLWNENKDYLSQIDSRFGDGDHGITIGKIASLMEKSIEGWEDDDMETFIEDLGDNTMEIGGGSAGPLYGTMIWKIKTADVKGSMYCASVCCLFLMW